MSTRSKLTYSLFLGVATLLLLALVEGATRTIVLARTGEWPVTALLAEYRDNRTVNHLTITSPASSSYSLVTVLQVLEVGCEKRWNIEINNEDTGTIVATRSGKRHVFSSVVGARY